MTQKSDNGHWLVRTNTVRWLWRIFIAVLALVMLAQVAFPVKGYFGVDGWLAFGAIYGFGACLIMVLVAKALGIVLKRGEDYYDGSEDND